MGAAYECADCNIPQPIFAGQAAKNNLSLRVTTPTFDAGLIEDIPDTAILANEAAILPAKTMLDFSRHENRDAQSYVSHFGWKTQIRSLKESARTPSGTMGLTSQQFPNSNDPNPCDRLKRGIDGRVDLASFFRRSLAAPDRPCPQRLAWRTARRSAFTSIGCVLYHTTSPTTGLSQGATLNAKPVPL